MHQSPLNLDAAPLEQLTCGAQRYNKDLIKNAVTTRLLLWPCIVIVLIDNAMKRAVLAQISDHSGRKYFRATKVILHQYHLSLDVGPLGALTCGTQKYNKDPSKNAVTARLLLWPCIVIVLIDNAM